MELTVGPNQFFWSKDTQIAFYDTIATAPVDRVVLGELVCSKRLPFDQDMLPEAVDKLISAGKQVALTSLALITLKRERKLTADLVEMGCEIEINDLSVLPHLTKGAPFTVGPLVNVYNEGTLRWLASLGATRVCLPPELPLASVEILCREAAALGVTIDVWGHGRLPLAISGRCYHARMHGRAKDNCQFACEDDPDGLDVKTMDGKPFMAMNGVQTLSDSHATTAHQTKALHAAGVGALRLSPQSQGFSTLCAQYRDLLDEKITGGALIAALKQDTPDVRLSDGFLTGARGVDMSPEMA